MSIIVLLAVCGGESLGSEEFIRIETEIELIRHQPTTNGVEMRRRVYPAIIITSTNRWSIETSFSENADEVHYYDGTNVYRWLKITKQLPQPRQIPGKPYRTAPSPDTGNIQVTINPGEHPLGNMGVNVPWLAYCSGNYLKKEGRVIPRPGGTIRGRPEAIAFADKTTVFEDALGLPKRVQLYTSRHHLERAYRNPITRTVHSAWADTKHPDGILVFVHIVEKTTNFFGFQIPLRFSMHQSKPGAGTNWVPHMAAIGKVISIARADGPVDSPYPGSKYTFLDYRFAHNEKPVSGIIYSDSEYRVAPVTDTNLQARFDASIARFDARHQPQGNEEAGK